MYDENINALYITYDKGWNDVISSTFGLRAEHTHIVGDQKTTKEKFKRNYIDFFPQISLNFDFADGDHSISLDASRSILRPYYNYLNPFKIWTSENTCTMGNVSLKSMIYTDVELMYILMSDYVIGANYSYGSNAFGEYTSQGENNTTVSSTANFGHEQSVSLYCNINKSLFKGIWRLTVGANADYDMVHGFVADENVGYHDWRAGVEIRNTVRLSSARKITGRLSYNYSTPSRGITKIGRHKHVLGLSLTKQFKFGGAFNIDLYNLFDYRPAYHYNTPDYSYKYNPATNNINVQIKYTQTFGHNKVRGARDRSSTKHLERFKK